MGQHGGRNARNMDSHPVRRCQWEDRGLAVTDRAPRNQRHADGWRWCLLENSITIRYLHSGYMAELFYV